MATLSCFAAWVPLLVILGVLAWVRGGFRARATMVVLLIVVAVMDMGFSAALKRIVGRARPREAKEGVRVVDLQPGTIRTLSVFKPAVVFPSPAPPDHPTGHSFPSSHTVNNFSAATVLTLFYRKRGWLYFIPAALVGYSRIYVGAHWPSDVIGSIFIAILASLALVALLAWAWRKFGARLMPVTFAAHPQLLEEAA